MFRCKRRYNRIISGVYKILCVPTGKFYIGSSKDIEQRWFSHIHSLSRGTHINVHLQRAWNKYGKKNFEFLIVEEVSNEYELYDLEQKYLDSTKCYESHIGFNINKSADRVTFTPEVVSKMIESKRNRLTPELRQRYSQLAKERYPETLGKYRKSPEGIEQINKLAHAKRTPSQRASLEAYNNSPESRQHLEDLHKLIREKTQRVVYQYSKNGELVACYVTPGVVVDYSEISCSRNSVSRACRQTEQRLQLGSELKLFKGYFWSYSPLGERAPILNFEEKQCYILK